jgi:phospholipase/carboxylesterase
MMNSRFQHIHVPAVDPNRPPVLLLHGTGGDETDLIELGRRVAPGSALLSVRGKVLENGMPRFFRRLAEGVFDLEDVRTRANELADFVAEARKDYGLAAPVALGFSNGANIAAAMMLIRPEALAGAALLRAMVTIEPASQTKLNGQPVLLLSGNADTIVPGENAARLAAMLGAAGARVDHRTLPSGHGLTAMDLDALSRWFIQVGGQPEMALPSLS